LRSRPCAPSRERPPEHPAGRLSRELLGYAPQPRAGLLRDQVTESDQTRLLDEFIDEVESASSNGSGR
jgi:hypothetical protein